MLSNCCTLKCGWIEKSSTEVALYVMWLVNCGTWILLLEGGLKLGMNENPVNRDGIYVILVDDACILISR